MGVTAGRKNSNSEILLKEALLVCQEMGAEVRMINLKDYNIIDCNGCTSCTMGMSMGKYTGCSLDDADDKKKIMVIASMFGRDMPVELGSDEVTLLEG